MIGLIEFHILLVLLADICCCWMRTIRLDEWWEAAVHTLNFLIFLSAGIIMFWRRSRSSDNDDDVGTEAPVTYPLAIDIIARAASIPIRLSPKERKQQRLLRGVMMASSYTDKVDNETISATKRPTVVLKELSSALAGFVVSTDFESASALLKDKDLSRYEALITKTAELCRRYKIMNPDLLRTDYVKFLYLMQDAMSPEAQDLLQFKICTPIKTVGWLVDQCAISSLLRDERLGICVTPVPNIADRAKLNKALRFKDATVKRVSKEYASKAGVDREVVELIIFSLNDANCFANSNVDSTTELISLLKSRFSSETPSSRLKDLGITEGQDGSRLTHEHAKQYAFVIQSLTLWKNISRDMFRLWIIAEEDLLNPTNPYEFKRTGQGYHRVQTAPTLYNALVDILEKTKQELGQWVGSEKIHLGDSQVPNAFYFIDKYAQISRIAIPVLRTVAYVDTLAKDVETRKYLEEVWGSPDGAKDAILVDFFRHAFDGSGGDNMDDAGSCIDGRLTSAWNWCNTIRTKAFFPLFLLAGFSAFDGDLSL